MAVKARGDMLKRSKDEALLLISQVQDHALMSLEVQVLGRAPLEEEMNGTAQRG